MIPTLDSGVYDVLRNSGTLHLLISWLRDSGDPQATRRFPSPEVFERRGPADT